MSNKRSRQAILGQDFGSITSKITLASQTDDGNVHIIRINANVPIGHPERIKTPYAGNALGEFCSFAGFDKETRRLVPGRTAFDQEESFPLKTIFTHRAGVSHPNTIKRLPGGKELLMACASGKITPQMEDSAVREHFALLRDQAVKRADTAGLTICTVILTHPNYLCEAEREGDFEKYRSLYIRLMRELWSAYEAATYQRITFQVISEGQATALYVCEPFSDPSSTFDRPQLWANFLDLDKQSGLNIVVADHGSSTLNFQVQSLYYDGDGRLTNSQSNCGPDWQPGAIGGSHSCNDAIRHLIRTQLAPHLPLAQVALLMRRFEEEKGRLDPDNLPVGLNGNPQPLRLIGTDPRFNVILSPYDIQSAYHTAFNKSLRVFRKEIGRLLALGKDFAVVFCGGSYHSPWLHRVVAQYMEKVKNDAAIGEKPFRVRYAFLTDQDSTWPSAVSAGAALSATRLPHPTRVINASAIALQLVRLSRGETDWVPSSKARLLLAKGCIEPQRVKHRVLDPERVIFRLVCDPNNDKRPDALRYKTKGKTRCFRPIRIGSPHRVLNGPLSVYDLGFEVDGREVPPGRIMFVTFGRQANRLATSERTPAVKNEVTPGLGGSVSIMASIAIIRETFKLGLSCYQIDDQSNKLKHPLDKRWELTLVTDPASKLLTVDEVKQLPVWCVNCQELTQLAYTCPSCVDYHLCDGCYDNNPDEAPHYGHGNFLKTLVADGYY